MWPQPGSLQCNSCITNKSLHRHTYYPPIHSLPSWSLSHLPQGNRQDTWTVRQPVSRLHSHSHVWTTTQYNQSTKYMSVEGSLSTRRTKADTVRTRKHTPLASLLLHHFVPNYFYGLKSRVKKYETNVQLIQTKVGKIFIDQPSLINNS